MSGGDRGTVDASSYHEESNSSLYTVSAKTRIERHLSSLQHHPGRCHQGRKAQSVGSHVSGTRPAPEFVPSLLSVWALKETCKLCRKAPYCRRQMRPSLSLCEHGLANRAERNSKPFKVWRHRWVLRKVPGTLRAGPNAVIIQVINTWPGTWCVPNDSAPLQSSLGEVAHLSSTLISTPLKHSSPQLSA